MSRKQVYERFRLSPLGCAPSCSKDFVVDSLSAISRGSLKRPSLLPIPQRCAVPGAGQSGYAVYRRAFCGPAHSGLLVSRENPDWPQLILATSRPSWYAYTQHAPCMSGESGFAGADGESAAAPFYQGCTSSVYSLRSVQHINARIVFKWRVGAPVPDPIDRPGPGRPPRVPGPIRY